MTQNDRYARTRDARVKLGELICGGMDAKEAAKIALPDDNNRNTHMKSWRKKGVYPFGEIDAPPYDVVQVNDTVVQPVAQMNDIVVQPTLTQVNEPVVQMNDSVVNEILMGKIEQLVNEAVEARIQSIRTELQSSSGVVKLRPRLKRNADDTIPTSFRFPSALVKRAKTKAKKDRTSLNAVVETFLWEYIGCPTDLLEE